MRLGTLQQALERPSAGGGRVLRWQDAFLKDSCHVLPVGGVQKVLRPHLRRKLVGLHQGVLFGLEEDIAPAWALALVHHLLKEPRPDHAIDAPRLPGAFLGIVVELHGFTPCLLLVDEDENLRSLFQSRDPAIRPHLVDHEDLALGSLQPLLHDGRKVTKLRAVHKGAAVSVAWRRGEGRELSGRELRDAALGVAVDTTYEAAGPDC
mmetsp:Transcript_49105/g.116994  ORF Transcript_49105/g.116994 Transcript_49105/m.116994 type:complete len:207 (-) Transcript_49105:159-779(-)